MESREGKGGVSFGKASRGACPAALSLLPFLPSPCAEVSLKGGGVMRQA